MREKEIQSQQVMNDAQSLETYINREGDHSSDEEQPVGNYGENRQQTPVSDVTLRRRSVRQQQPVSRFGNL